MAAPQKSFASTYYVTTYRCDQMLEYKVEQKVVSSVNAPRDFVKLAQLVTKYLGYSCQQNCHKELS